MVALQVLSKCLQAGNINIIEDNGLTEEYFTGYEDEYNFIINHYKEYGNTPDDVTFQAKFPEVDLVEVSESDRYLVDTIREEHLFYMLAPEINEIAKLSETDANAAVEYMIDVVTNRLRTTYRIGGVDIISQARQRYDEFVERKQHQEGWFFTTGLPELDEMIHGIQREEELFVIFARTNQGKSWVLEKICSHIWEIGFNVGYISPEMGASSIGYRFDTLYKNFDNKGLVWGNNTVSEDDYEQYIEELTTKKNKFVVATPSDFDRRITITKLKNWIKQNELNIVAIDGITYISDERSKRGDNKTTSLTNIAEDLMSLSMELKVPVLVVMQANRGGVADKDSDDLPELENMRDSDGVAFNASKVISLRQKDDTLLIQVKKQRNGSVGGKIAYTWNANVGEFISTTMSSDDSIKRRERPTKKKSQADEDVF